MDLVGIINKVSRISRYMVVLLLLIGLVTAQAQPQNITNAMRDLCDTAVTVLGVTIALLIVMSALVYGVGQIMGAETRARATVWATAMMTGAVIGAILYIILPWLIGTIIGGSAQTSSTSSLTSPCGFNMNVTK